MSPGSESWFDRLAAPHTRRQNLKAAIFGAAATVAASLPFIAAPPKARAEENPTDCRKGCVYVANREYANRSRLQNTGYSVLLEASSFGFFGAALGPIASQLIFNDAMSQADKGWHKHREAVDSCFLPYCGPFDKDAPGGPCDSCNGEGLYCNPCPTSEAGYECCVWEPGDCHGDCCTPGTGC